MKIIFTHILLPPFPAQHHENDDRRTKDRCDRTDGQLQRCKRHTRNQVAHHTEDGSAEERSRDYDERTRCAEALFDEERDGNADKRNRTGKCGDACGENTRKQNQRDAEYFDVDTHALRIRLTELVCTDRFCHQERDDKGDADHSRRDRYVAPAHAGEASL